MMMYVLLLAGFLLLTKGVDFLVESNSSVAKLSQVFMVIIGLTIMASGTNVPELTINISVSLSGSNDITVGNVVGSNTFNLLMVVGACSMIIPMAADKMILYRNYLFFVLTTAVMLALFAFDHISSRPDGVILLLLSAYFLYKIVRNTLTSRAAGRPKEDDVGMLNPVKSILSILGGLAVIVAGGSMVINSASPTASSFGLSETLTGLTVVALGTLLPELVISVVASRGDENGLTLSSIIGPNPFNVSFVLAASATISSMKVDILLTYDAIFLVVASIITWFLAKSRFEVNRRKEIVVVLMYVRYTAYIIMR